MEHRLYNNYTKTFSLDEVGEVNSLPSVTVPDESLSVKDILQRFVSGQPLDIVRRSAVFGDDLEQSEEVWDVHPSNQFEHDLLDLVEGKEVVDNITARKKSKNATTNLNDDAKMDVPDVDKKVKSE